MKKLVLESTLNHKQSSYEPMTIEVEKVITLYGNEFQKLMRCTLSDNPYIKENRELMYQDGNTAHCVLFVDYETGNGMLTEAEGYDYARRSQFIPNARALLKSHELTAAEWKIHEAIKDAAGKIAELAHCGDKHLSLNEFFDSRSINIRDLLLDAVTATLCEREDIHSAERPQIDVPCQPYISVEVKPTSTLKFFSPLRIEREPEYETDWDGGEDYEELSEKEKIACMDEINAFIEDYTLPEEEHRGLMVYYSDNSAVNEKVFSAFPSVEVKNGELMGVLTCKVCSGLTTTELKELRGWWSGQESDGWGEGAEQHEIKTGAFGNIFVHFWDSGDDWSISTEEEIDAPEVEESLEFGAMTM